MPHTQKPFVYFYHFRIYLDDTDAGGIVYHANHLKYMERTRREWLRSKGFAHYSARDDYQFVVHSSHLNYLKPLRMDDVITVALYPKKIGFASLDLQQNIYHAQIQGDFFWEDLAQFSNQLATTASIKLACVDKSLKPAAMPKDLASLFKELVV